MPPLIADVQSILDGPWMHRQRALDACRARTWPAFVAESAPPKPLLVGRLDYAACLDLAARTFAGPRDVPVTLAPLWAGSSDEGESEEWHAVHGVSVDGGPLGVAEIGPFYEDSPVVLSRAVACRARLWKAAVVVDSSSYAPGIPLLLRRGAYAALELEILEVLDAQELPGDPLPRPAILVPPFCGWYEPRVSGLSPALSAGIRALDVTTDEEGNLVPRP